MAAMNSAQLGHDMFDLMPTGGGKLTSLGIFALWYQGALLTPTPAPASCQLQHPGRVPHAVSQSAVGRHCSPAEAHCRLGGHKCGPEFTAWQ